MTKVHLLLKKEEIDQKKMEDNKIAVVFDVLLATSTIVTALYYGAKEVIPVLNERDAKQKAKGRDLSSFLLVGEYEGTTIEGFLDPNPLQLVDLLEDKTMILSTTNGTVAINNCSSAKKVYICSLLNGKAIADHIHKTHIDETIVIVCSGSSNHFCIEDFYGAGYFLDCLIQNNPLKFELSDSARAALLFFQNTSDKAEMIVKSSRVGRMLEHLHFDQEIKHVVNKGVLPIVASLSKEKSIIAE
ncbi:MULTISPECIES: 2-phosphosulfolactate phosphatase [Bacillus]|uniref:2-phosphosulfolactate phosphatase n=1 Tax=Bacillus TaxID=1386 RepID=UPI0002EBE7D3|nr:MULTISPECIES: 2-phosphosulfolactate phosphatase [Bacillus]